MSVEGKIRKKYRKAKIPEKSDVLPGSAFTTDSAKHGRIRMFVEFAATGLAVVAAIMLIIVGQSVLKLRNSVEKTGEGNFGGVTTLEADGVPGNSGGNEETTAEPQTTDPDSEPEILYNGSPLQLYSVLIWSESDGLSVDGPGSEYTVEKLIPREVEKMPVNYISSGIISTRFSPEIKNGYEYNITFEGVYNIAGNDLFVTGSDLSEPEEKLSEIPCGEYVICFKFTIKTVIGSKCKYILTRISKSDIASIADRPAMIMLEGKLFYYENFSVEDSDYFEIIGYTSSCTEDKPSKDGEINFSMKTGLPYARLGIYIAVKYEGRWYMFREREFIDEHADLINDLKSDCIRIYDIFSNFAGQIPNQIIIPEFPDAKFEINRNTFYANEKKIIGGTGYGCSALYLTDLTGDSKPELCIVMSCGSGIVDERVVIIDLTTGKEIFHLSDRMRYDYLLFVKDNKLCVRETKYRSKKDICRTGTIVSDNGRITVLWDRNADFREDDQENLIEHAIP